jgi:hypothetical protein
MKLIRVNYMLSSIFLLRNRFAKASIGLAEFDRTVSKDRKAKKNEPSKTS